MAFRMWRQNTSINIFHRFNNVAISKYTSAIVLKEHKVPKFAGEKIVKQTKNNFLNAKMFNQDLKNGNYNFLNTKICLK